MTEKLPNPFSSAAEELGDPEDELIGTVIGGRYSITRVVGRGGMGVVYGGEHLELRLPVAIKVLPAAIARDAETLKRFEREARTASRVRHPNVVTVFDLGRLESGEPYLVMELLDGHDLAEIVDEGRALPLRQVIEILEPLAAALDALHHEGVVHRDIKPSNVFFSRGAGGVETVKLVDFGLAALHGSGGRHERLTRTGHIVGTAVYMAPEGARGALVGPAGDIYSLGVMAFEMLAGQVPFDGDPMAVLIDKVQHTAPSMAEMSRRQFDPRLEGIIASALSRTPDARPASAKAFVASMREVLESGGGVTRSDPHRDTARGQSNAHRAPAESGEMVKVPSSFPSAFPSPIPEQPRRAPWIGLAAALIVLLAGGGWYATRGGSTPVVAPPVVAPVAPPIVLPTSPIEPIVPTTPDVPIAAEPVAPVAERTHRDHARAPSTTTPPSTPAPSTPVAVEPSAPARVEPAAPARVEPAAPAARPTPTVSDQPTPDSTDRTAALLRDASSAMLHGEIPRARDLYREATQASPGNPAAWRGLGLACERLNLIPEATRAYRQYLEIAPNARDATTVRERLTRLGG